jgi:hypothetical protein
VSAWSRALAGVRIGNVAESYHAVRSRRDPEWRLRAIAAAERYRRAKEADPDRVLDCDRR